jgi:hypothetical protein
MRHNDIIMKKITLILFMSLSILFSGSINAGNKESVLARECLDKIKTIDANRKLLPKKFSEFSYYPLRTITGSTERRTDGRENYCSWWRVFSTDAIYGDSNSCAWGSVEVIEITVNGKNRFNENHESTFDCAYRGMNYELDGIKVLHSGRPLLEMFEEYYGSD